MSRQWFESHRPYAWSTFPDCTATAEQSAVYTNRRLFDHPASFAEGDLADEPRTLAVVDPNNLGYQQCVDTFKDQIGEEGNEVSLELDYTLDPAQLKTQAASLMAKLKTEGATSVSCAWAFGPGHYTPVTDIREIWWDPDKISPFNGKSGSYADNGQRYAREDVPEGDPEVFP